MLDRNKYRTGNSYARGHEANRQMLGQTALSPLAGRYDEWLIHRVLHKSLADEEERPAMSQKDRHHLNALPEA